MTNRNRIQFQLDILKIRKRVEMNNLFFILIIILFLPMCNSLDNHPSITDEEKIIPTTLDLEKTQITFGENWDFHPRWSNKGDKIAFARFNQRTGETGMYIWDKNTRNISTLLEGGKGDFSISWSPDDTKIVFDARDENDISQLYIITIADGLIEKFTDYDSNSFRPDWAPNGQFIVFSFRNSLYKINIIGGELVRINNTVNGWNPSWSSDNSRIIFSTASNDTDIFFIDADGDSLNPIGRSYSSSETEVWPRFDSINNRIIYEFFDGENSEILLKNLNSGEMVLLTRFNDCRFPDFSSDGSTIVFSSGTNLWTISI